MIIISNNYIRYAAVYSILVMGIFLLNYGCSDKREQYDTLSIFFTGMPTYEEYISEFDESMPEIEEEEFVDPFKKIKAAFIWQ